MNIFPFGEIPDNKYKICIDYGLLEQVKDTNIWRLTNKCNKNYDAISFLQWLQGKREKPIRLSRQKTINELLKL